MKTRPHTPHIQNSLIAFVSAFGCSVALQTSAAAFDSGSDGSSGAITAADNQNVVIDVPSSGVFQCTTVYVGCNATLRFNRNSLNTPVYLLATGDVTIRGQIVVTGAAGSGALGGYGGPGGFPGGMGGIAGGHAVGGDGAGPGGGKSTNSKLSGAFGYPLTGNTNVYGNALLYPIIGGSGGAGKDAAAGGYGGGGGGGALLVASNSRIDVRADCGCCSPTGYINARGGNGAGSSAFGAGGSGGAIRLIAPIVSGNGSLDTTGGQGGAVCCTSYPDSGSLGRIRIDCLDDYSYRSLSFEGSFTRGSQMFVFRSNSPRLDVLGAAGQSIALGTTNAIIVSLPFGAPTNQIVKVRAENFTNNVPVRIAVTPDTGPSQAFDGVITNIANVSIADFNVVIPPGTVSRIDVWTR